MLHERGQWGIIQTSFRSYSPLCAENVQYLCALSQPSLGRGANTSSICSWQLLQLFWQCGRIQNGFLSHSPKAAQKRQWSE
ncbi:hypothetical protein PMAYCL1PPCAC_30931 [Pristionchus mayeri]|uniref:Uncharacterized protein n=1 Tax=Pristionchus mayeri TaxID=1317129 RepID=A0AAN5IFB1_9BILA|nr:hypothetical protein PMAYCL1PPCAC_30931 [Pristionchus mayeri]